MPGRRCLPLVLPLALVLVGQGRTADDKMPETLYLPLKVGEALKYKIGDARYTRKVAQFEDYEKQPCAVVQTLVGDRVASWERVAVKADGVYRYSSDDNRCDPPVCFLKLPIKDGDTWQVDSTVAGAGKVTGTFKTAEVPEFKLGDKKYEKVVQVTADLDAGGGKMKVTYVFAKDVGLITQAVSVDGQEVVMELEPGK
jgi:hypothetical protein